MSFFGIAVGPGLSFEKALETFLCLLAQRHHSVISHPAQCSACSSHPLRPSPMTPTLIILTSYAPVAFSQYLVS